MSTSNCACEAIQSIVAALIADAMRSCRDVRLCCMRP
jgi:hypothetical protein